MAVRVSLFFDDMLSLLITLFSVCSSVGPGPVPIVKSNFICLLNVVCSCVVCVVIWCRLQRQMGAFFVVVCVSTVLLGGDRL